MAAVDDEKVPAGHKAQYVLDGAPATAEYVALGHDVHTEAPVRLKVPATHMVHDVKPVVAPKEPAKHGKQADTDDEPVKAP